MKWLNTSANFLYYRSSIGLNISTEYEFNTNARNMIYRQIKELNINVKHVVRLIVFNEEINKQIKY